MGHRYDQGHSSQPSLTEVNAHPARSLQSHQDGWRQKRALAGGAMPSSASIAGTAGAGDRLDQKGSWHWCCLL